MTKDKELFLLRAYPSLFPPKEERSDPERSCLAWGFECGDGWFDILNEMMKSIDALHPKGFSFLQIKEKFGTLRVYWGIDSNENEEDLYTRIDEIITRTEQLSEAVCEDCGGKGRLRTINGWSVTLCDPCTMKRTS